MNRTEFEALGDVQKSFEGLHAKAKLMPGVPVLVRLDGRAFHTFTKGLARPYDERLSTCMIEATKWMVHRTNAVIGYTQSDEISLLIMPNVNGQHSLFDGKVQKLCSVLAAELSVKFNQLLQEHLPEKADALPVFDARVWTVPDTKTAIDHFRWREADATRNSLTMLAHAYFSHKDLQGKGGAAKHDMLHGIGVNWNDCPAFFKRGTYVQSRTVAVVLTDAELNTIPEKYRPTDGTVFRTVQTALDFPPIDRVGNVGAVFFDKADPYTLAQDGVNATAD